MQPIGLLHLPKFWHKKELSWLLWKFSTLSAPSTSASPAFTPYIPAAQAIFFHLLSQVHLLPHSLSLRKNLLTFKKPAGTIQPYRSPYPPYHDTVPYLIHQDPKRHLSHFITACRDTATGTYFNPPCDYLIKSTPYQKVVTQRRGKLLSV